MPKKRPNKTSFKVSIADPLLNKFDKAILDDGYDGRSELVIHLIRNFLTEREQQSLLNTEYLILKEKRAIRIEQYAPLNVNNEEENKQ